MRPTARKRCHRFDEPGHAHELTFSCFQRLPLLTRDRTRQWLAESIAAAKEKLQFDLWAYVFMPEHVHLLIWPRRPGYRISAILWNIKRPVAVRAISFLAEQSPHWLKRLTVTRSNGKPVRQFWQPGGGYDRNVIEPVTAHRIVEYIHRNPVRRGLVERAEDWMWSSARWYAGLRDGLLPIDPTLPRIHEP